MDILPAVRYFSKHMLEKNNSRIDPDMQQKRLIAKRTQTQMTAQTPSLI